MMKIGAGLVVLGVVAKMATKSYKAIRAKEAYALAKQFYKGGFQAPMTRREAQLILNVREGADLKKISNNHRKLMLINHPDNEGSTFIASKINEAKELLLK